MFDSCKDQREFMTSIVRDEGKEVPREKWPAIKTWNRWVKGEKRASSKIPPEIREKMEQERARILRVLRWNKYYWVDWPSRGLSVPYATMKKLLENEPSFAEDEEANEVNEEYEDEEEQEEDEDHEEDEGDESTEEDEAFCNALLDAICTGDVVYYRGFDGGSPAHGGSSDVTRWGKTYWAFDAYDGVAGPCDSIEEALRCLPAMTLVSGDGTRFSSSVLTSAQIAERLWMGSSYDVSFTINRKPWSSVREGGKVRFEPEPVDDEGQDEEGCSRRSNAEWCV